MTPFRVLVVDDEPDGETLFRQQFRREVRGVQHASTSHCPARPFSFWTSSTAILESRSFCWSSPTSICPA